MENQKKIEALELAIDVLQKKVEKLKAEDAQTLGKDPVAQDPTKP